MKIKKGDNVKVITGSSKGKTGKVTHVLRAENRVVVEGVNIRKIHKKKSAGKPGQIVEVAGPINASNVSVIK